MLAHKIYTISIRQNKKNSSKTYIEKALYKLAIVKKYIVANTNSIYIQDLPFQGAWAAHCSVYYCFDLRCRYISHESSM